MAVYTYRGKLVNKIYSNVWNKALGQWVVASELAKNQAGSVSAPATNAKLAEVGGLSRFGLRLQSLAAALLIIFGAIATPFVSAQSDLNVVPPIATATPVIAPVVTSTTVVPPPVVAIAPYQ